jgi:hypothetical protein
MHPESEMYSVCFMINTDKLNGIVMEFDMYGNN